MTTPNHNKHMAYITDHSHLNHCSYILTYPRHGSAGGSRDLRQGVHVAVVPSAHSTADNIIGFVLFPNSQSDGKQQVTCQDLSQLCFKLQQTFNTYQSYALGYHTLNYRRVTQPHSTNTPATACLRSGCTRPSAEQLKKTVPWTRCAGGGGPW